ncbi:toxin-antitoxin system HicB family antitoxin [Trichocoleus sp. ST-U3]
MNITANIPDALYQQVEALARRENISVEQLLTIALSAQVSAWMTKYYIEEKAKQGNGERFQQVLKKVPDVEPEACDRL